MNQDSISEGVTDKHTVCIVSPFPTLPQLIRKRLPDVNVIDFPSPKGYFLGQLDFSNLIDDINRCEADIIVMFPFHYVRFIERGLRVNIKWFHSMIAGTEGLFKAFPKQPENVIFTRMGEGHTDLMAEYVLGQIISREQYFPEMLEYQKQKKWDRMKFLQKRSLANLTIGLLGTGAIGSKVASVCKAFGMTVWGLSRTKKASPIPNFDNLMEKSELSKFLSGCDYVCSVLPSTPETNGMLSGNVLQACQRKRATFINIGRGGVVDELSLLNALDNNWIGGAILDATEKEPLPPDSKLWSHPDVILTPHISGPCIPEAVAEVFVSNYHKFVNGDTLDHQLDWERGY
ncbi:glyoxylate/hydroxypyruvate reductase A-like [Ostrea edulis]|uniref:glyoxylate/hydroxypyruvate reductase A-like n=1 Tax=Ostrea edulis TaxID=37623 RepID=UPI0024AEC93B|nr:glyoxylate/hydroxypyruvate reductase A-like [Ostrea edulis]XP_048741668.2 glyoxylate/hydroxypyruvate reductase A-like [Ostrea edulis]